MSTKQPNVWSIFVVCALAVSNIFAQGKEEILPKLKGLLPAEVSREEAVYFGSQPSEDVLPVIMEAASPDAFQRIENLGGKINTKAGNLATVQLPKKILKKVALLPEVLSLEYNKVYIELPKKSYSKN